MTAWRLDYVTCRRLMKYDKDAAGFWGLWDRNRAVLYGKCLSLMGDAEDAEDALSTAMLRAMKNISEQTPDIRNFTGWAMRLTENVCFDLLRKRKKTEVYEEEPDAGIPGITSQLVSSHESVEDRLRREEIFHKTYHEMERLPVRLREAAILRLFIKMPYRDIAVQLNLTEETVRKRVQQARAILEKELKGIVGNSPVSFFNAFSGEPENGHSDSTTWLKIKEKAETILNRQDREINVVSPSATRIVKVSLPSGTRQVIPVFLKSKPIRNEVKIKTLQEYINRYPGGWKKRMELAEILYAVGQWGRAVTELRRVVDKHPRNLDACLLLGRMLMNTGEEEKAVEVYQKAFSFVRKESSRYFLSGMSALCRNRVEEAVAAFQKAVTMEPHNEMFFQTLALSLLQADRPGEALEAFETALTMNPRDLVSLTYGYEPLVALGRLEKAEEYIDRILEIHPSDMLAMQRKVELRCRKGYVQGEEGKITKRLVRRMNQLAPKMATLLETKNSR